MGLLGTTKKRTKAESLMVLEANISEENLSFLADLAEKKGINEKISKNKNMIKLAL